MINRPDFQNSREELLYLAGLLDGEGCVYMGLSTRKHTNVRVDCWLQIGMTHHETIELAAELMRKYSGDPCLTKGRLPRVDKRGYNRRYKWTVMTSSKLGTLNILKALRPFVYTKQLETRLAIQFLERSCAVKKYYANHVDVMLAGIVRRLKKGCGEAPAEARLLLLGEVIPNQATLGLDESSSRDRVEGLQTTGLTPKNNAQHECPTTLGDKEKSYVH